MKIKLRPVSEQVVVVFGASSGIGRLAALEFAKRGARIMVAARSEDGLQTLVQEIKQAGGEAIYVTADAANFEQVKAVADAAVNKYQKLDTWVHAAAFLFARFEQTTPEEFRRLFEVNLLGQVHGALAALPHVSYRKGRPTI